MKQIILLAAFLVVISGNLQAQEKKMSKEEMQKICEAYAAPGDMHKMLAKAEGVWNGDVTMWMDPSMAPTKSKGTATVKMILGGRFQHVQHTGMMDGKPF